MFRPIEHCAAKKTFLERIYYLRYNLFYNIFRQEEFSSGNLYAKYRFFFLRAHNFYSDGNTSYHTLKLQFTYVKHNQHRHSEIFLNYKKMKLFHIKPRTALFSFTFPLQHSSTLCSSLSLPSTPLFPLKVILLINSTNINC